MTSEIRYHIASLAAVFLALGIGILIGTAFVGAPVVERQNRLIQRLDTSVDTLRRETREMERNEAALRTLAPPLMAGKLDQRRVLVVQAGDYDDAAERAEEALRLAGATVTRVSLPRDEWLSAGRSTPALDAERLARLLIVGSEGGAIADYRRADLLDGDTLEGPVRLVVLVGGMEAPTNAQDAASPVERLRLIRERDAAMLRAWADSGITAVGVEPLNVDVSAMRAYQAQDVATIDSIDHALGQLALPFALLGEKAAYGMKPTADRVLPASLEQATSNGGDGS